MTKFFTKIKNAILKHKIRTVIVIIILAVGVYYGYPKLFPAQTSTQYVTQPAAKTTITVSVTGSGQVSDLNRIDLKPAVGTNNAIVSQANFKTGDLVKAGQVVVTLDQKNNLAALSQAQSSLANAQANYQNLLSGPTALDKQISQNSVNQAQTNYNNAVTSLASTKQSVALSLAQTQKTLDDLNNLNQPSTKRDSIVNTIQSQLNSDKTILDSENSILTSDNLKNVLSVQNTDYLNNAQNNYSDSLPLLDTANNSLNTASLYESDSNLSQAANDAITALNKTLASLNSLYSAFQNSVTSSSVSQSQLDSYKSSVSGQVSSLNSGIFSIQTAEQSLTDAITAAQNSLANTELSTTQQLTSAQNSIQSSLNSWQSAKDQYAKLIAPATASAIATAKAQISSASSQLQQAQTSYNNNLIVAPFDGQIAVINVQVGDQVGASTIIATIITQQRIAIIPLNEVDAAKVQFGDKVIATFDAITDLSLTGKVAQIDNLGTVSQGVVTYNVKITFDTQDTRVKTGMSVNTEIITAVKPDVLAVPNAAVTTDNNGNSSVQILVNNQPQTKAVQIGLANDTSTEITSGLNEGDQVVTQTITGVTTPSTSTGGGGGGVGGIRLPGIGGGGRGFGG